MKFLKYTILCLGFVFLLAKSEQVAAYTWPNVGISIPVYGNWCGPGHGAQSYDTNQPIAKDMLDYGCRQHDFCYEKNGYSNSQCDKQLVQYIDNNIGYMKNGKEWATAKAIRNLFAWKSN